MFKHGRIQPSSNFLVTSFYLVVAILISFQGLGPDPTSPSFSSLSEDGRKILLIAKGDRQSKLDNLPLIERAAQSSSNLLIRGCAVRPVVIKLAQGQELTFKNLDSVDHTLQSDLEHQYLVPANKTKSIIVDFGHGVGVYSILCDDSPHISGIYLVAP